MENSGEKRNGLFTPKGTKKIFATDGAQIGTDEKRIFIYLSSSVPQLWLNGFSLRGGKMDLIRPPRTPADPPDAPLDTSRERTRGWRAPGAASSDDAARCRACACPARNTPSRCA